VHLHSRFEGEAGTETRPGAVPSRETAQS